MTQEKQYTCQIEGIEGLLCSQVSNLVVCKYGQFSFCPPKHGVFQDSTVYPIEQEGKRPDKPDESLLLDDEISKIIRSTWSDDFGKFVNATEAARKILAHCEPLIRADERAKMLVLLQEKDVLCPEEESEAARCACCKSFWQALRSSIPKALEEKS